MGSLKIPFRTSYKSSIETTGLNCFLFEKIAFCVHILATDKQTDKQTVGQTDGQHRCVIALLAVASGALITVLLTYLFTYAKFELSATFRYCVVNHRRDRHILTSSRDLDLLAIAVRYIYHGTYRDKLKFYAIFS